MFVLDNLILNFINNLILSSYMQFITAASILVVTTVIFPEKKKNDN